MQLYSTFQLMQCEEIAKHHSEEGTTKLYERQLADVIPQTALIQMEQCWFT